jgi:hypothetical protein
LKFRWARHGEAKRTSGLNHYNVDSYFKDHQQVVLKTRELGATRDD